MNAEINAKSEAELDKEYDLRLEAERARFYKERRAFKAYCRRVRLQPRDLAAEAEMLADFFN